MYYSSSNKAKTNMLLSIVIATFRSKKFIVKTLAAFKEFIDSASFDVELILVDDGSCDGTYETIMEFAETTGIRLTGLELYKNSGQFQATLAGLRLAKGDYIVTSDDDLEYSPGDIHKLLAGIKEDGSSFDVILGVPDLKNRSFLREFGSLFYRKLGALLTQESHLFSKNSCFRIMTKGFKEKLLEFNLTEVFLGPLINQVTTRIGWVSVGRNEGLRKSNYSFTTLLKTMVKSLQMSSSVPIKYISALGFFISSISFVLILGILFQYFTSFPYPILLAGWTSLILSLWFLGGVTLLSVGVVGQYVYLNRREICQIPNYQIRQMTEVKKSFKSSVVEKSSCSQLQTEGDVVSQELESEQMNPGLET